MDIVKGKAPHSSEAEQNLISAKANTETFWTGCYSCRMRYEYPKIFLNEKLQCIKCKMAFDALEMPPPKKPASSKPPAKQNKKQQPERKGRRNEQEEWQKMLMEKGKKESKDLLNRLKALSM